jgi:hypothetical protein
VSEDDRQQSNESESLGRIGTVHESGGGGEEGRAPGATSTNCNASNQTRQEMQVCGLFRSIIPHLEQLEEATKIKTTVFPDKIHNT